MTRKAVLVVEDNPAIRSDATILLEEAGLQVIVMANADAAFAYTLNRPDGVAAIFTDAQATGDMNGKDLAQAVTVAFPEIAVLVTSQLNVAADELPSGVGFVRKPWLPLEVLTVMQRAAA